jgi:hypothetical protein
LPGFRYAAGEFEGSSYGAVAARATEEERANDRRNARRIPTLGAGAGRRASLLEFVRDAEG